MQEGGINPFTQSTYIFGGCIRKKLLEIGCGRGESLKYHAEHKADELWGIDISEKQIEKAKMLPVTFVIKARKLN